MTYVALFIVVVLAAVAFVFLSYGGAAVVLVLGLLLVLYLGAARKENPDVGAIQTARRDPTGTPRSSSAGADTANKRVGQE